MCRVLLLLPTCGDKRTWQSVPSSIRKGSGQPWQCTADACKHVLPGEPVRGGQVWMRTPGASPPLEIKGSKVSDRSHPFSQDVFSWVCNHNFWWRKNNYIFNLLLLLTEIKHFLPSGRQATTCGRICSSWDFIPIKLTDIFISYHTCADTTKYQLCWSWLQIRLIISPTARMCYLTC